MSAPADWDIVREVVGSGRLSVVMPVYNLAGLVADNLAAVVRLFESAGVPAEIVPVDDGSTDSSWSEIAAFAASRPEGGCVTLIPVRLGTNSGKGAALKAGFAASSGELVLLLDGDLDIKAELAPRFFAEMEKTHADVVVGSKRHPDSEVHYPWHRRLASRAYFTMVRLMSGLKVSDTQTGMKLFRRRVLGEALDRMLVKTYAFDLELLAIACSRGAKIVEAPVKIEFGCKFGCLSARTVKVMLWDTFAVFYRLKILGYYAKVEVPRKTGEKFFVSVVIACPRSSWMLEECLAALKVQTWTDFEVIVLPDGDEDLREASAGMDVKVIPTGKVRPAEKRNLGIRAAAGSLVAFIDDDAYPDAKWLESAVRYFTEPTIGALGGPAVTPPGDRYLARIGGRVYSNPLVSGGYRYRYRAGGVRRGVDDYPSCNLFVRRDVLARIGGYRTDFWPGEDTLLCKDIVDAGWRIVYDPWVVVYHHRRPLWGAHLRQLARYAFHRGYFVKRFPSNSAKASYFVPSAFVLYASALAVFWALSLSGATRAGGGALACASAPMAAYLALTLAASFSFNPVTWLLTWTGVMATHFTYGVKFASGLAAAKAPCEYIGKDHAK